uniref:Uncharacterized protein n=1 Tax=Solanum lycopersicum TaxID=4081 RepID=A0A3Q7HID3_SOLLC
MVTRTLEKTRCIREFSETLYKLYQWEREERLPLYLLQILLAKERDSIVATNMSHSANICKTYEVVGKMSVLCLVKLPKEERVGVSPSFQLRVM